MTVVNLSERLPIWKVEKHLVLSKTQALSTVLKLDMPHAYSLSGQSLVGFYKLFNRIVKAIPKGYIIHKQDYYSPEYYSANSTDKEQNQDADNERANTFLSKAYEAKFNERLFYDHQAYLIISKAPNGDKFSSSFFNGFVTGRFVQKDIREGLSEFENTVRKVLYILSSGGIGIEVLQTKQVDVLLNRYFNLGESRILGNIEIDNDRLRIGWKDVVFYNSVHADVELPNHFDIDLNLEEFVDRSFTYPLGIGLNAPHIVNTIIRKNDPNVLLQLLAKTREKIMSMSLRSRKNAQLVDEYDHFLTDTIKTAQTPVFVSQNITLFDTDRQLHKAENELNNALAKMDIYTQRNINCANLFWGCCPGNAYELPKSEFQIQLSDAACMLFPIETNPKNNGVNGIKLSERDFGVPVTIDTWNEPMKSNRISNRNMFILGPSGSGKSFFTNHMTRQFVEQGYHVTIIDVGGSYKRLCQLKKGTYFEYTASSKMSFNPFYLPRDKDGLFFEHDLKSLQSLRQLLFTIWKRDKDEPTKEEQAILSKSIDGYYLHIQEHKIAASFNTYFEYVFDLFEPNVKAEQRPFFDFNSFKVVLEPYYKGGPFDYLLNNEAKFSISDLLFCVFELDEIRDHPVIFPIVTLVIMDAFITKMRRHKEARKIILIEEAWSAFTNPNMALFLKYLFKTVRKFNGAVCIITQEVEDILASEILRDTILNNADTQFFLDQSKYINKFGPVANKIGIPQSEKKKIMSINKFIRPGEMYKEVYCRQGAIGTVYGVIVSLFEAATYTTDAIESAEIDRYIERNGGDAAYGILRFLEDKHKLPIRYFADQVIQPLQNQQHQKPHKMAS